MKIKTRGLKGSFFNKKTFMVVLVVALFLGIAIPMSHLSPAKIIFVGDMSFDRHIRKAAIKNGQDFVFSCNSLESFLKDADVVVGNLEGPITDRESVSVDSIVGSPQNFTFTFPPSSAKLLKKYNFKIVNLGNNHIDDFGKEGMMSTRNYLDEAGVEYFGGYGGEKSLPGSSETGEPILRKKLGGTEISFISYNQFGGMSPEKVAERIKEEKEAGRTVIVYTHWGEEYIAPTASMHRRAELFADAGAKLVIGSHPHVIQPNEIIGDTIVYYSLGNFVFDQYWDSSVSTGLALEVNISDGEVSLVEHKVKMERDGRTCLVN